MIMVFHSLSPNEAAQGAVEEDCSSDYIWVRYNVVTSFDK